MSAPRAWWMFKAFGHQQVSVLNGGLPQWLREGRATESGLPTPHSQTYEAVLQPNWVATLSQVEHASESVEQQILDLRSKGRFQGIEPEPRPGLRSGHIPHSMNLPWSNLIDPEQQQFHNIDTLQQVYTQHGVDLKKPVICSCGSGITACIGALGLYLLGQTHIAVYDGSWAEWGARSDLPLHSDEMAYNNNQ